MYNRLYKHVYLEDPMQVTISFTVGEAPDVAELVGLLAPLGGKPAAVAQPASAVPKTHDVIRLYDQMAENESPRLLEALTTGPLTFQELADRMAAAGSSLHSVPSMRAIYRNIKRREKGLAEAGILSGPVVRASFDDYGQERAGRYYLDADAVAALKAHLA
jgi:hypothetical protein